MHILIADDEPRSALLLQKLVLSILPENQPANILHSFHELLPTLQNQPPDILFLDVVLHGLSAFDLLDKIQERSFPVVITSASSEYAYKAFEYGVSGYLLKPINAEELFRILKRQNLLHPQTI